MDASQISQALQHDALTVVFINVLLQQLGLPLPVLPTLLLAGGLAASWGHWGALLMAAIVASVVADAMWYTLGKKFGYRVLAVLCKLSLNPASCVSQTEARFIRWGLASLVLAKFIPGFSTVAPPIAGAMRMGLPGFLLAAALGAGLWAGMALGAGWILKDTINTAMASIDQQSGRLVIAIALLAVGWLAWKLWQKFRFKTLHALPHITPEELIAALETASPPRILDLRGATMIAQTGPIAGAVVAEHDLLHLALGDWPKDQPVITLCACPEDAGAIQAARSLIQAGYLSVRPLRGGYEAWQASIEPHLSRHGKPLTPALLTTRPD
jgi:membrane protein DedA with SNARE-associated domain/rhodanese-related sulfurtransferase